MKLSGGGQDTLGPVSLLVVAHVLSLGHFFQMLRVDAVPHFTQVIDDQAGPDASFMVRLEGEPMDKQQSRLLVGANIDPPVAMLIERSIPQQAVPGPRPSTLELLLDPQ